MTVKTDMTVKTVSGLLYDAYFSLRRQRIFLLLLDAVANKYVLIKP